MRVCLSSAPIDAIGVHLFTLQVPRWIMQDWTVFFFSKSPLLSAERHLPSLERCLPVQLMSRAPDLHKTLQTLLMSMSWACNQTVIIKPTQV